MNASGTTLYVTNEAASDVSVVSTSSNTVIGSITGFTSPTGIAINGSGSLLYVANRDANTVSVVNTSNNSITVTSSGFSTPYGIVLTPSAPLSMTPAPSSALVLAAGLLTLSGFYFLRKPGMRADQGGGKV